MASGTKVLRRLYPYLLLVLIAGVFWLIYNQRRAHVIGNAYNEGNLIIQLIENFKRENSRLPESMSEISKELATLGISPTDWHLSQVGAGVYILYTRIWMGETVVYLSSSGWQCSPAQ